MYLNEREAFAKTCPSLSLSRPSSFLYGMSKREEREGDLSCTALADQRNLPKIITGRKRDGAAWVSGKWEWAAVYSSSSREGEDSSQGNCWPGAKKVLRRSYNVRSSQTGQASSSDLLAAFFAMPTSQCHDGIVAFDERISHPQPLMPWMCTPYTHTPAWW